MNKTKQMVAVLAILALGVGGYFAFNASTNVEQAPESNNIQAVEQTPDQTKPEITFSEDGTVVSYVGVTDKTALELLQAGTDVTTESSDFGDFVTGINGVLADGNEAYWSFYVDGEYASEGAGTYVTTDGEKIEWKLEQI